MSSVRGGGRREGEGFSCARWAKVRAGTWFGSTKRELRDCRCSKLALMEGCISLSESDMLPLLLLTGLMIIEELWGEFENRPDNLIES